MNEMKCPKCKKAMEYFGEALGQLSPDNEYEVAWGCKKCRYLHRVVECYVDDGEQWFDELFE